jgi:hypothetical protein
MQAYTTFFQVSVSEYGDKIKHLLFPAIQVVVPFGVALPMVKKETSQGRRGRTQYKMADHEHPVYGIRLARLDNYFNQLEVCY